MTRTLSAFAVALMLATPALAEGTLSNNGLPEEAVAVGQVNYTVSNGQVAKQDVAPAAQTASVADQQVAVAGHDDLYFRQ